MDVRKILTGKSSGKDNGKARFTKEEPIKKVVSGSGGKKPNPDNKPQIEPGDCFFHKESRKLYQVMGFEKGLLEDGTPILIVLYTGVDGKLRKQNLLAFLINFKKTSRPKHTITQLSTHQKELGEKGLLTLEENPKSSSDTSEDGESLPLGFLYKPTERHTIDKMVVWPDARESIETAIHSIANRKAMASAWHLSEILDEGNRTIINLWGPSGTGKTMLARCISKIVEKPLFQVDYSQIVDKYVGETAKKIKQAFDIAREKGAILFFDEADSLCSKRVDMNQNSDYANSVNTNRNVLMQELDKFDDIVIMSTNFFNNFDDAMLRRVNRHIEIKLPNKEMREKLFKLHIPVLDRAKEVDFAVLAEETKEFSGGDIKNVCVNSMEAASMDQDIAKWNLTMKILTDQIEKVKESKEGHKKAGSNSKQRTMGFGAVATLEAD